MTGQLSDIICCSIKYNTMECNVKLSSHMKNLSSAVSKASSCIESPFKLTVRNFVSSFHHHLQSVFVCQMSLAATIAFKISFLSSKSPLVLGCLHVTTNAYLILYIKIWCSYNMLQN